MAKTNLHTPPPSWSEPLTAQALAEYGHLQASAPADEFEPHGQWTQRWQIYLLRKVSFEKPHAGHIEVTRKLESGKVRFAIRQAIFQGPHLSKKPIEGHSCQDGVWLKSVCDTQADVTCSNDKLLTPESWTLNTAMRCTKGRDFEGTRLTKEMRIRNGNIELTCNGNTSTRALPAGNITSNWGLLNATSTIKAKDPVRFTLLDGLDKVKTGHKLYSTADTQIEFGGETVKVYCYHQIGRGCLPWEYYVDASTGRLLLAISGLRAYILDDSAAEKTAEVCPGFFNAERTTP